MILQIRPRWCGKLFWKKWVPSLDLPENAITSFVGEIQVNDWFSLMFDQNTHVHWALRTKSTVSWWCWCPKISPCHEGQYSNIRTMMSLWQGWCTLVVQSHFETPPLTVTDWLDRYHTPLGHWKKKLATSNSRCLKVGYTLRNGNL